MHFGTKMVDVCIENGSIKAVVTEKRGQGEDGFEKGIREK